MEIVDKIKVATSLRDIKVWQYAKCVELLTKEPATDQEGVSIMCSVLELCTDKPAHIWREQYKMEFAVATFEKVKAVIGLPLPVGPLNTFVFTTLTPEDFTHRKADIVEAFFWKRSELRSNLAIDTNRKFTVEKSGAQTFEQVIQTEMILKEIVRLDADIVLKSYIKLPRLLAFVCKLDGEKFHYYDKNDSCYKFNYPLIDYREKVFMHLDIETAWGAYLAFFLTVRQNLEAIKAFGKESEKEWSEPEQTGKNTLSDGD